MTSSPTGVPSWSAEHRRAYDAARTLAHVEALAQQAAEGPDVDPRRQLDAETPAISDALAWSVEAPGREETLARLVVALARAWQVNGRLDASACWVEHAATLELPHPLGLRTRITAAYVDYIHRGDYTRAYANASLLRDEARALGADTEFVMATSVWAACVYHGIDPRDVAEGIREALDRAHSADAELRCGLMTRLGGVLYGIGQHAAGADYLDRALELAIERGLQRAEAFVLVVLGEITRAIGDWPAAVGHLSRVLEIDDAGGFASTTTTCANLGNALARLGRYVEAARSALRGLASQARGGAIISCDCLLLASAGILLGTGMPRGAVRLLAAADAAAQSRWEPPDRVDFDHYLAELARAIPAEDFQQEWEAGNALPVATALELARELLPQASGPRPLPASPDVLSPREREVLELLAAGCSNRDIASTLVLSVRTVESHVASICGKLGVRTRGQAAARAIAAGIVTANPDTPLYARCESLHGERCFP